MSLFNAFSLSFGSLLALQALIAGWLFRTASAPLWSKILIPALIVALGCYSPIAVNRMLGYPVSASMTDLPDNADLVAFVPHDGASLVDLWLIIPPADTPRAYETALDARMKQTLRAAQEAMERGGRASLTKTAQGHHKGSAGDPLAIGDDEPMYVLDPRAMSNLPAKE